MDGTRDLFVNHVKEYGQKFSWRKLGVETLNYGKKSEFLNTQDS